MEDDNRPEPESHPMTSSENLSTNKGKEVFAVKAQVHYSYETKVKSVNKAEKENGAILYFIGIWMFIWIHI